METGTRQMLAGTLLLALGIFGCTTPHKAPVDTRLAEAQQALEEGQRLRDAQQYKEAVPLAERALALREAVLGSTHLQLADCLILLGNLRARLADTTQAEALLKRALAILEANLGPDHPDTVKALSPLANLYLDQGHTEQGGRMLERALAIREAALGPNHPDVASSLNSLASVRWEQGRYAEAEPLYQRVAAIREAALGPNHPDVAKALVNLGKLYLQQRRDARAEPLFERALAIREAAFGPNHPEVASSLSTLALLFIAQGHAARAESLFKRALSIQEATLGPNHPRIAALLGNMGLFYSEQGLPAQAEPVYARALAIQEANLGPAHPQVAIALFNLAKSYMEQGQYARAEPLSQRSLAIQEAAFGPNHPYVAISLTGLGILYYKQEEFARAEPLLQRALAIQEAVLGPKHPLLDLYLANLGTLYADQGDTARAEPLFERALANVEAGFGPQHPETAGALTNLALLRLAQQRPSEAVALFERAFRISEVQLRRETLSLSEARLASFLQALRGGEERLYSLARAYPDDARVQHLALAAALLRKGRSVEELAHTSRTIFRSLGAQERDTFEQLRALRTQFAELSLAGSGEEVPEEYQRRLKELMEQGDTLEARLAQRSAPLRALNALPPPDQIVERVAQALPKDSALAELVAYTSSPLATGTGFSRAQQPGELRYLALVLLADGRIRVADLGPAAPIDQAVHRLNQALTERSATYQPISQELYRLAFLPLRPLLGATRHLFLSTDGQLSLASFAALHDGKRFLVDTFELSYLTSGKDLLPRPEAPVPARSVVVLADPDFDAAPAAPAPAAAIASTERSPSLEGFFSKRGEELVQRRWPPLPGTRQEALAIQRLLPQAQLLLGAAASKQALLQLPAPGLLHIATHGFFREDSAVPQGSRGLGYVGAAADLGPREPPPDPLLRSGLVLAGARSTSRHPEDSLVTAMELSGMNLWGTQLVVLSACDTGKGDIKLGQGVYGLRRALGVAGAQTVVMSLWKVNDETTRQLMEDYYRRLLDGASRAQALREAMKALRVKHPHPYYWAPFISIGQEGPLKELTPQRGR